MRGRGHQSGPNTGLAFDAGGKVRVWNLYTETGEPEPYQYEADGPVFHHVDAVANVLEEIAGLPRGYPSTQALLTAANPVMTERLEQNIWLLKALGKGAHGHAFLCSENKADPILAEGAREWVVKLPRKLVACVVDDFFNQRTGEIRSTPENPKRAPVRLTTFLGSAKARAVLDKRDFRAIKRSMVDEFHNAEFIFEPTRARVCRLRGHIRYQEEDRARLLQLRRESRDPKAGLWRLWYSTPECVRYSTEVSRNVLPGRPLQYLTAMEYLCTEASTLQMQTHPGYWYIHPIVHLNTHILAMFSLPATGDLYTLVRQYRNDPFCTLSLPVSDNEDAPAAAVPPLWINIAHQVAQGITYIQDCTPLVHLDVKPANFFYDGDPQDTSGNARPFRVMISDLGMCVMRKDKQPYAINTMADARKYMYLGTPDYNPSVPQTWFQWRDPTTGQMDPMVICVVQVMTSLLSLLHFRPSSMQAAQHDVCVMTKPRVYVPAEALGPQAQRRKTRRAFVPSTIVDSVNVYLKLPYSPIYKARLLALRQRHDDAALGAICVLFETLHSLHRLPAETVLDRFQMLRSCIRRAYGDRGLHRSAGALAHAAQIDEAKVKLEAVQQARGRLTDTMGVNGNGSPLDTRSCFTQIYSLEFRLEIRMPFYHLLSRC